MGGTCGSGIVSSAADVIWMSVVRGMRGVVGVCVCLVAAWVETIGFGFYQSSGNRGSVGHVSVFWLLWSGGEWVGGPVLTG